MNPANLIQFEQEPFHAHQEALFLQLTEDVNWTKVAIIYDKRSANKTCE